ncbi:MAG TPA: VOC family protein [Bacteroidia bacterium]|jgi:lactoylglutathione lyase|nr:VOC family protein [Bacteroidia bacterium]HQF27736.1 VOC family protein [Bacteroidia bacterium]HQK97066.1 VOC family protein [Bacteroidia bacterium]
MVSYILNTEVILYVHDEKLSAQFYTKLLRSQPDMIAPGMIEFNISNSLKLGLMPSIGIAKIITPLLPHPDEATGIPRCELYFIVADVDLEMNHAVNCGAKLVSESADRNWGDKVGYIADPDGHVIAFAQKIV